MQGVLGIVLPKQMQTELNILIIKIYSLPGHGKIENRQLRPRPIQRIITRLGEARLWRSLGLRGGFLPIYPQIPPSADKSVE